MSGSAHVTELELPRNPDQLAWTRWATVRQHFDIRSFGVNAWTSNEAGDTVIGEHDEMGERAGEHEELYFVVQGRARFTVAGDEIDAPAGTFVFVRDPAAKRAAVAEEPETTVLVVGAKPGAAFTPSPWERSAKAFRFWGTGEFEKAVDVLTEALAEYPEDAGIMFNLACAESRAGRAADAIAHLKQAVEIEDRFAELAEKDADFDPIRDEPEFASAIAGKPKAGRTSS